MSKVYKIEYAEVVNGVYTIRANSYEEAEYGLRMALWNNKVVAPMNVKNTSYSLVSEFDDTGDDNTLGLDVDVTKGEENEN